MSPARRPFPCVACNQQIKFRELLATARDLGADLLATGHYIQRRDGPCGPQLCSRPSMPIATRATSSSRPRATSSRHLWFPLGAYARPTSARWLARFALPVADKPDSQDICFVPTGRYTDVIERLKPGAARSWRHRPRRRSRARPPRGHHPLHHWSAPGPQDRRWGTAVCPATRCRPQRGGCWTT